MKNILSIAGAAFLLLIVAMGGVMGYSFYNRSQIEAESLNYGMGTLTYVLSSPTGETFRKFMAPKYKDKLNVAATDKFFAGLTDSYGAFEACDDWKSGGFSVNLSPSGKRTTAKIIAQCHFAKGSMTTSMVAQKTDDDWNLLKIDFDFNSARLATAPASSSSQKL